MPNNKDKQTESAAELPAREEERDQGRQEPPLGTALFRVMRALIFDDRPVPELDALPLAQLRLLMSVYYGPNATMKDFSERLNVSQSTVTQLAERLVRRGLIVRVMDAQDRRVIRLHTSAQGEEVVGQADATRKATLRKVWLSLSTSEQELLEQALTLLGERGEKIRAEEGRPLAPLPEPCSEQHDRRSPMDDPHPQPVDLMTRRVRGK